MFKKILVPVDGSRPAHNSCMKALELAKIHDSDVEIIHVISFSDEYVPNTADSGAEETLSPPDWINEYLDKVREHNEKMLAETLKAAREVAPGLNITTNLLHGQPGRQIVTRAKKGGFDLIVIGNRGLSGIKELVLGSVSHRVVDDSSIPVLVIK
ncbi:MAG: universal stress protein [Candidatus Bathyarchaeota archaeon]|nr:MAG: universal stress protein [Candidatus Bathyarchaeota archaeon]